MRFLSLKTLTLVSLMILLLLTGLSGTGERSKSGGRFLSEGITSDKPIRTLINVNNIAS